MKETMVLKLRMSSQTSGAKTCNCCSLSLKVRYRQITQFCSRDIIYVISWRALLTPKNMQIRLRVDWIYPWLMINWNRRSQFAPSYDWDVTLESSVITFLALAGIQKHSAWESRDVNKTFLDIINRFSRYGRAFNGFTRVETHVNCYFSREIVFKAWLYCKKPRSLLIAQP